MKIWVLSDLHLAVSTPGKEMDFFGGSWVNYTEKIQKNWQAVVGPDDLVLIPGDISWAIKLKDAIRDFEWIDKLPGTKVILRGNHDLWWGSLSQVRAALPPSMHAIQNDIFTWNGIEIAGSRLWDTPEYSYSKFVNFQKNERAVSKEDNPVEAEKIFVRELSRLETSLKAFTPKAKRKLAMVHYPPIGPDLQPSRASALLEKYGVETCVFGHIHQVPPGIVPMGEARGVKYHLTSADYLDFMPLEIT